MLIIDPLKHGRLTQTRVAAKLGLVGWAAISIFGAALFAATPKSTPRFHISDPTAFVREVYRNLQQDEAYDANRPIYTPPENIYTRRLGALYSDYLTRMNGEIGCLDFSFWVNAQDSRLSEVDVSSRHVQDDASREIVNATFRNAGAPEEIEFDFQRSAEGWLLVEVRSLKDRRWTLSDLLRCKDRHKLRR